MDEICSYSSVSSETIPSLVGLLIVIGISVFGEAIHLPVRVTPVVLVAFSIESGPNDLPILED